MLNLLRALRFNIEEFCASERIFVQNREIPIDGGRLPLTWSWGQIISSSVDTDLTRSFF